MNKETRMVKREMIANNMRTAIMLYKSNPNKYRDQLQRNIDMVRSEIKLIELEEIRKNTPTATMNLLEIIRDV